MTSNYKFIDEGKQHLHMLDEKPLLGTSTVCNVLAKPLTWWASGMAVSVFGWLNPKNNPVEALKSRASEVLEQIKGLDVEGYLELLKKAYGAHNEKKEISAEEGIDMHSLLEKYVRDCIDTNNGSPLAHDPNENEKVGVFIDWSLENVEKFILCEAHVYSERMWTGGIFDVLYQDKKGKWILGDFKSSKEAYLSHFIQIAGYDLQFTEHGALDNDGNSLRGAEKIDGYVVFPFGAKKFEPSFRYNTEELRKGFESALCLYKLTN